MEFVGPIGILEIQLPNQPPELFYITLINSNPQRRTHENKDNVLKRSEFGKQIFSFNQNLSLYISVHL